MARVLEAATIRRTGAGVMECHAYAISKATGIAVTHNAYDHAHWKTRMNASSTEQPTSATISPATTNTHPSRGNRPGAHQRANATTEFDAIDAATKFNAVKPAIPSAA